MMRGIFNRIALGIVLACVSGQAPAWSQKPSTTTKRPLEKDVLLEKAFIDATREKILGNYNEAITLYLDVLQKNNDNPVVNFELARLYDKINQLDNAVMRAERAVVLDKTNLLFAQCYTNLLEKKGEYRRAAEVYPKLIEAHPNNEKLYHDWAYYLAKSDKPDQALKAYATLEKQVGIRPEISLRKHQIYLSMNKAKKAEDELTILIKNYPDDIPLLLTLAQFYKNVGKNDKARDTYRQIVKIDPNNSEANVEMSSLFLAEGDEAGYLRSLASVFADPQQSADAKVRILEPLVTKAIEKKDAAYRATILDLAQKITIAHPAHYKGHWFCGRLYQTNHQYAQALDAYQMALSFSKNSLELWQNTLEVCYELRRINDLSKYSDQFVDLFPSNATGYYYQGISQYYKGDFNKASKTLQDALPMAASDSNLSAHIQQQLGKTYAEMGSADKAEKAYESALAFAPEAADIMSGYAYSLAFSNKKLDQATTFAQKSLNTDAQNPMYQTTYGFVLYKKGNYSEAKTWFEKALQNGGGDLPETLERYGDTLYHLDDKEKAVAYWQKTLDKGVTSTNLQRKVSTKQLYE